MHNWLPAEYGYSDENDVRKRCWRDSLPALALAYPVAAILERRPIGLSPVGRLAELAHAGDWTQAAALQAQTIAPVISRTFNPDFLYVPYNEKSPVSCPDDSASDQTFSLNHLGERA
jgi:hypothetical protein